MTILFQIQQIPWYKRIEILRTIKGWTQEKAAEMCGTTQKVYWLWENGKSYPRLNSKRAIARAFGVSVNEIFGDEDRKEVS
ncbi:MAG: helix-turn-helix transcriptional regulator [Archaeoglobus sp.]|nr:helix-turn-helix transcriptional regulator [Archaeoglobus sp.]